jgi:lipoprotein-releasing system permease protein
MGMYDYDSKFVLSTLSSVQNFVDRPGQVTSFKLKLASRSSAREVSDRLADNFGYPFRSKDWGQLNKNLFYAIQLEKTVIAILLTAIILVAAFNTVSTLMMMIYDKNKEIAILKAMGLAPRQSFGLFCLIGMGIGVVGTVLGCSAGLGLNWILGTSQWIRLPADIYYIDYLPVIVRWSEVGLIAICALLISFGATLYPALSVSRRSPLEGLRYE